MKPRSAIKTGLFAFDHHRKKIDSLGDPLAEIESYIDFAALAAHGRSAEAEHREILRAAQRCASRAGAASPRVRIVATSIES